MSNFEKIEAYIEGWMDASERAAFERALQTDAALQRDYEDWIQADKILKRNFSSEDDISLLKEKLQPLTTTYFVKEQKKTRVIALKRYLMAISAAAAILVIYFALPAGLDNYSLPDMPQAVVRGSEALSNKGAQLFNAGKYGEALPLLRAQATANPNDATTVFFYAACLVKSKDYKTALPLFEKLANGSSVYNEDAAFFAALAAYKQQHNTEALQYAARVSETSGYYKNAQKIIKKLR